VGCGKTILDEEIAIVNPATLVRCPDDHIGEIWVAGRNVASGYWNHCEETRETFCGRLVDDDAGPFLRTGDLGFLHEGELFITGRLKDIIILNGVKHYPQDIEAAAEEASADVQPSGVAAFTVGEGRGEHVVVVAEVRRPLLGHEGLQQLAALIRHTVSESCEITVQDVVLICRNTLPKTTSAKVERRRCRDMYLAGCLQRYDAATGNHVETFKAGDRNAETLSAKNGCGEQAICEERILDPSVMHQRV
jgi:acyl-CoA synthetase (AMP-forming)/AMP-acid ligase II